MRPAFAILGLVLKYVDAHQVFVALAEPTRQAILERLSAGPASVSDLARPFDLTLAAVVQHLQLLERTGLVKSEKVGRVRTCSLDPSGLRVAERWITDRRSQWERKLDRLGGLMARPAPRADKKGPS